VFGDDVIIFSDKNSTFDQSIDVSTAWGRWYKRAVWKSAGSIYKAERWIREYKNRIYLDRSCTEKIPVDIPEPSKIRIYRVAVAHGVYNACKEYFGGNSIGSLMVDTAIVGDEHYNDPFYIGHVNPSKGYIHVFDDFTVNVVLKELDTVSDFIKYLSKKEKFLTQSKTRIMATGEEELLAKYLTNINKDGKHDFVLTKQESEKDFLIYDEGVWDGLVRNPLYAAKKEANDVSYTWDRLVEHFIKKSGVDELGQRNTQLSDIEWGLRKMASEPRLRRRQLSYSLMDVLSNAPINKRMVRVVHSNDAPEITYVFLLLPVIKGMHYDEYRAHRRAHLIAYCKVAKLRCPRSHYIIGIATERTDNKGKASEEWVVMEVIEWTDEMEMEAEQLSKDFSLLLGRNVVITKGYTSEFPDSTISTIQIPDSKTKSKKKKARHKMRKNSRRKNR